MKESRPAFDTLKERIASGTSGGVVVYKLSRFGRNVKQVLKDVKEIEDQGALFVCVDPTIDTSTPAGQFMLTVFAALDEMEVGNIAVGWSLAKTKAVERGIHISRHVPPGYKRRERKNGTSLKTGHAKKKIQGPLAPDPKYGPVVTKAFAMAAQGEQYNRIAAYLTEAGLPIARRRKGVVWEANRIRRSGRRTLWERLSATSVCGNKLV
jgi:DNA invertase Pin-like site-specific DNA recombinase